MSPQSKGRPPGRGRPKPRQHDRPLRTPTVADRVVNDATEVTRAGALDAEIWASAHLGWAWAGGPAHDPAPELRLLTAVADRARLRPALAPAAAAAALARLLPPADLAPLAEVLAALPPTPWSGAAGWTAVRAARQTDVYGSARSLLIRFDGPEPHVLMAGIEDAGGAWVTVLEVLDGNGIDLIGAHPDPEGYLGPLVDCPPGEALADLAAALRTSDLAWPRRTDEEYLELRALAWSRCRDQLPPVVPYVAISEADRTALVNRFLEFSELPDNRVNRAVAGRLVDFGDAWLPDPLAWSPAAVEAFFDEEMARAVPYDDDEMDALGDVLTEFVRFALTRPGLGPQWVAEAMSALEEGIREFLADAAGLDPEQAQDIIGRLLESGVDVTDEAAVENALRQILDEEG